MSVLSILWFSTKRSHDQICFRNVIVVLVYFVFFICKQPDFSTLPEPFFVKRVTLDQNSIPKSPRFWALTETLLF